MNRRKFEQLLLERIRDLLSPWCRCICREYPDGTMCKLCGHVHTEDE